MIQSYLLSLIRSARPRCRQILTWPNSVFLKLIKNLRSSVRVKALSCTRYKIVKKQLIAWIDYTLQMISYIEIFFCIFFLKISAWTINWGPEFGFLGQIRPNSGIWNRQFSRTRHLGQIRVFFLAELSSLLLVKSIFYTVQGKDYRTLVLILFKLF